MPPAADVRIRIEDVHGDPIAEAADVLLTDLRTGRLVRQTVPKGKRLPLAGLSDGPMVIYRTEVDPPSYLRVSQFLAVSQGTSADVAFVVPADPTKARPRFDAYGTLAPDCCTLLEHSTDVLGFASKRGQQLFEALDGLQRAGLLNIICKCANTPLPNGRSVLSYLKAVYEVRGDRSFFVIDKELRERVKSAATTGAFHEAPDKLHHPPEGYTRAGSWKTPDRYGNLQITFWGNASDADWRADVDIDDAGGLEHVFQVVRNQMTGQPTHPYAIHQILVKHQKLAPSYRLAPVENG